MDIKKAISTIVGLTLIIVVVSGLTFAWYAWKQNVVENENQEVVTQQSLINVISGSEKLTLNFSTEGTTNLSKNSDPYIITFNFNNDVTTKFNLSLNINTIDNILDDNIFYEVKNNDVIISKGLISSKNGQMISLATDLDSNNAYSVLFYLSDESTIDTTQGYLYNFSLFMDESV